eukprot:3476712-Amphidinium_carterae.1
MSANKSENQNGTCGYCRTLSLLRKRTQSIVSIWHCAWQSGRALVRTKTSTQKNCTQRDLNFPRTGNPKTHLYKHHEKAENVKNRNVRNEHPGKKKSPFACVLNFFPKLAVLPSESGPFETLVCMNSLGSVEVFFGSSKAGSMFVDMLCAPRHMLVVAGCLPSV